MKLNTGLSYSPPMDALYIEKWNGKFDTARGKQKYPVFSLWRWHPEKQQINRIAEWVFYPWGGEWEDDGKAWKNAKIIDGRLHKIGLKHAYPLHIAKTLLCKEQQDALNFLLKYPERGWANYQMFISNA